MRETVVSTTMKQEPEEPEELEELEAEAEDVVRITLLLEMEELEVVAINPEVKTDMVMGELPSGRVEEPEEPEEEVLTEELEVQEEPEA